MKQRITLEQLQELTDKQKDKLREWWKPSKGDFCVMDMTHYDDEIKRAIKRQVNTTEDYYEDMVEVINELGNIKCENIIIAPEDCLPLLSMGQCIELLAEHNLILLNIELDYKHQNPYLKICNIGHTWRDQRDAEYISQSNEPIDAFWDLVKKVL